MVESVNKTNADGTPEQDKPKVQLQIKSSPVVTTKVIQDKKTQEDHMDLLKKTVAQLESADGEIQQNRDGEASTYKNGASSQLEKQIQ